MAAVDTVSVQDDDIIVVGSGIAGLVCALSLAPRSVTLITKTPGLAGGSSFWAKGGIAAALGRDDSAQEHARDTLAAGAGLSDPAQALSLAEDGIESLQLLIDEGVLFDRALDGTLELAREAAHKHARVVHAGGDATGELVVSALIRRIQSCPTVRVLEDTFACDFAVGASGIEGLMTISAAEGFVFHRSANIVLATGGIGMAWWSTTNPEESTGDGLAMAARAGATLTDLEFMQFHPTALAQTGSSSGASLPLLTEALRGAGAQLIDETGYRFMLEEHPSAELAPRDVIARAIHDRITAGQGVFLDLRPVIAAGKTALFPRAMEAATKAGFDPQIDPLPVTPAAHYHMGGVKTDRRGRTSVDGLWACGEVATTGIHGANRLASNSLLEGLVYARRVANDVATRRRPSRPASVFTPEQPQFSPQPNTLEPSSVSAEVRKLMSESVGISRSAKGLERAVSRFSELHEQLSETGSASLDEFIRWSEAGNVLLVARLVTLAALRREESRGSHYRDDFPCARLEWQRRQGMTIESIA